MMWQELPKKTWTNNLLICTNFVTLMSVDFFWYGENVYSCEYMNDWLELVWSNITVKHWFLQRPEHGRYSWCRLEAYGKSFGRM